MRSQDQTKYTTKLLDSRVLIIGGSSGLGYGLAEACLEHGAHVTISSSNPTRISSAVASLQTSYPSATPRIRGLTADLSDPTTIEDVLTSLFNDAVAPLPGQKLDHVLFTAGDALSTLPISSLSAPAILKAGQIRFLAPLLTAKLVARFVEPSHRSSYTITTGSISERPMADWSVVAAYAGGHHSMVRNLALDLRPVRVNGVSPGVVDTGLWKVEGEERERFLEGCAEKMATGRVGRVEDVVESFLGVLRDWNCDGSVVRTDGGALFM
ncbi:NAD(P)-binding protein [Corynespora cassiicola Philippines]|uniref:NAD(P)-binding protein n=1 Tax=Corynespora cassiicola Philippines TaxID=1448308 RepID=A0A2T2P3G7_CORCC|nr:NAD(P)-binding protein [Corynespora cassiicola Philippines]